MILRFVLRSSLILFTVVPIAAWAQWEPDGVPLCAAPATQESVSIASDGAGGAIVVWWDLRAGNFDVYAQRVDASGNARWGTDGVAICTVSSGDYYPCITADGAGGAIIAWKDLRSGVGYDIRAQRIDADGNVEWTANGVLVCGAVLNQSRPAIVADGTGGAIVTWHDYRTGTNGDIYAQRVNASGIAQWTANGVAISTAANGQLYPVITTDGVGGAIIAWQDFRDGDYDVYARRVDAAGAPLWTAHGVAMCVAANQQVNVAIASDGVGGAIVAWQDNRSGTNYDVYARRALSTGVVFWGDAGGTPVTTAAGDQTQPVIAGDGGDQGAFVAWTDRRSGTNDDIYAQRMNQLGGRPWSVDGVAMCTAADDQLAPSIVYDDADGAIVVWQDQRAGGAQDIYAQRVNFFGVQWSPDGVPVCTAVQNQFFPKAVMDGFGGAIVAWHDPRSGVSSDVYAQRIGANGDTPTGIRDTPSASVIALRENYPNPFSTTTVFDLELSRDADVTVDVFDAAGRRVRKIHLGHVGAGSRRLAFDALDDHGRLLASGVYFYRVRGGGAIVTRKMVIVR